MQESKTMCHAQKSGQRIICDYVWEPRPSGRVTSYNKNAEIVFEPHSGTYRGGNIVWRRDLKLHPRSNTL